MRRFRSSTVAILCAIVSVLVCAAQAPAAMFTTNAAATTHAASCTAAQKAKAASALRTFKRTIAVKRKAFFRTHASPKARQAFAKKQNARRKRLERAARCTVPVKAPPPDTVAPSTPGGISVSRITRTSLVVSWVASSDNVAVVGYAVYRDSTLVSATPSTGSLAITGLVCATTYRVQVVARDAAGNASAPAELNAATSACPLAGPGAPATYVLGAELTEAQRAEVPPGLDMGARYYRAVLGRELPAFTVWAHTDLEAMIRTYAETRPTTPEEARRLWEGGQVGHAVRGGKVWLGPNWFVGDVGRRLKIAAHEAFHLLQFEVTSEAQWFGGLDDVRPVGPWWLLEGAPEYFAHLAVVDGGALALADVRVQWASAAKASATPLQLLETFRGQQQTPGAYDIYALAAELLVKDRDPKAVMAYFESVGSGVAWPSAFVAAFGRSPDAFYAEFAAYRASL